MSATPHNLAAPWRVVRVEDPAGAAYTALLLTVLNLPGNWSDIHNEPMRYHDPLCLVARVDGGRMFVVPLSRLASCMTLDPRYDPATPLFQMESEKDPQ